VLEEANAIGTTYLRSQFLPPKPRGSVTLLLRSYVAARLAFHAAGVDPVRLEAANAEASGIERQLWSFAVEAAVQNPTSVPTGLFVESLNAVIDLHEKRLVAFENRVPEPVLYVLLVVSMVAFALLGYGCGLRQDRRLVLHAIFALLIVFVLTTILDMDRPRRGLITVPQESLLRLQATLDSETQ
jgi:hypothetical protein